MYSNVIGNSFNRARSVLAYCNELPTFWTKVRVKIVPIQPCTLRYIQKAPCLFILFLFSTHTLHWAEVGCDWAGSLGQMVFEAGCWVGWRGGERVCVYGVGEGGWEGGGGCGEAGSSVY